MIISDPASIDIIQNQSLVVHNQHGQHCHGKQVHTTGAKLQPRCPEMLRSRCWFHDQVVGASSSSSSNGCAHSATPVWRSLHSFMHVSKVVCRFVCVCMRACALLLYWHERDEVGDTGKSWPPSYNLGIRRMRSSYFCTMMNTHAYIGITGLSVAAAASGAGPRAQGRAAGCAWALPGTRHP